MFTKLCGDALRFLHAAIEKRESHFPGELCEQKDRDLVEQFFLHQEHFRSKTEESASAGHYREFVANKSNSLLALLHVCTVVSASE